jgi:hypothetical protein
MSKDPEILPPAQRSLLPKKRDEIGGVPSYKSVLLSGLQAKLQARAHDEIADNIRAQTSVLEAETVGAQAH